MYSLGWYFDTNMGTAKHVKGVGHVDVFMEPPQQEIMSNNSDRNHTA